MQGRGWSWLIIATAALCCPTAATAQIAVMGSLVHEREATPGESYSGRIQVRNEGTAPREVRVYQTDYRFHADGRTDYGEAGSHGRSNAAWTAVTPPSLVVPGGETVEISYRVTVPETGAAALVGTYWSMLMVEALEAPTEAAGAREMSLRTVVRYGVQVATHLRGTPQHGLRFGTPQVVVSPEGARSLEFEVSNEGEWAYRPNISLEVYDADGALAARLSAQRGLLYPGTSTMQKFVLPTLTAGTYEALVVVDTGAPDLFGAQFRLVLER